MKPRGLALLAVLGLAPAALVLAPPVQAEVVDRVAAVVNEEVITLSEIYELGGEFVESVSVGEGAAGPRRRAAELEVLEALIQRELIHQEIDRLGLSVTREELDRTIDDLARQNGLTREQLRSEVEKMGIPWALYRQDTREQLVTLKFEQLVLLPRISVTQDEVLDLYNRRVRANVAPPSRDLSVILLAYPRGASDEAKAEVMARAVAIKESSDSGIPWETLLIQNPDNIIAGGAMGQLRKDEAVVEMQPAFEMDIGQVSEPIALSNGVILIKVVSETAGEAPAIELVQADLRNELMYMKMDEEMEVWTAQARRQASVSILLEPPEAL